MNLKKSCQIFPKKHNPYYIVTPPFARTSAGIKALHILCHHLNLNGYPSYLIITNRGDKLNDEDQISPDYLTPILSKKVARHHFEAGFCPITIYPETVSGNPLNSPCVARYVLNFPGLLGGDKVYPESEYVFSYSKELARSTNSPEHVVFIPTSDTDIFCPPQQEVIRSGSCFYAAKYQEVHQGALFPITQESIEITRRPEEFSPEAIAAIFRKSKVFYTYENTALATEATLCGCPVAFLPNPHLEKIIASEELGQDGYAWGADPAELARAEQTVAQAYENYQTAVDNFHQQLKVFTLQTQDLSKKSTYVFSQHEALQTCLMTEIIFLGGPQPPNRSDYAEIFTKLPWWLERFVGEILCTIGFEKDGTVLWRRATERFTLKNSSRQNNKIYAGWLLKTPWTFERSVGQILIRLGLTSDGEYLVNRATVRSKTRN